METFTSVVRILLLLGHLMALAVAFSAIMHEDYNMLVKRRINPLAIKRTAVAVYWSLLVLFVTGVGIIGLDTGFDLAAIASKPKILAKLTVVGILSLNGAIIHNFAFPAFKSRKSLLKFTPYLAVLAAISGVSWLYAAFLGLAKPLTALLGYGGFMGVYFTILAGAIAISLIAVRPLLSRLTVVYPPESMPKLRVKRLMVRFGNEVSLEAPTTLMPM